MNNIIKTIEDLFLAENGISEIYADRPLSRFEQRAAEIKIIKASFKNQTTAPSAPSKPTAALESPDKLMKLARELADGAKTLEDLKKIVCSFDRLSICKTAINTVFSDGNPSSKIMAIGEAPGANEDETSVPFCGISGHLLDKMFSSIGLYRDKNIYITNSVFWRPPGNRKPTPEETMVCLPFLEKHIALINPDLIILVGATACSSVLATLESISKVKYKENNYTN
jgi:DNA polymerase